MLIPLMVSAFLFVVTVILHFEAMQGVASLRNRWHLALRVELLSLVLAGLAAHLAGIALYAVAYYWMHDHPSFGALKGNLGTDAADFLYFSLTCYTTLGFGDGYATRPMRIISGMEALNGLVLIAWSASFTFVAIERVWRQDGNK